MHHPRLLDLCSSISVLGALLFGLNACGGASSSPPTTGGSPGYSLTAAALNPGSMTAGNTAASAITVTPANGYAGSVTLSCGMVSGGAQAPACSFSPNPVSISGPGAGSSTLTVSTTAGTPGGSYAIKVTGSDQTNSAPSNGSETLSLTMTAVIEHVVVVFQENRTPDNLFQDPNLIARGADIQTSGQNSLGDTIALQPIDLGTAGSNAQNYDLSHTNGAFVSMYDGGKMDGADLIPCVPQSNCPASPQFMYVKPADVAPYFRMAEQYTFGDRMFQTNQGPSFPAHQFIFGGTSAPTATSNLFAAENPNLGPAGCLAPPAETVAMIDPTGSESGSPPAYPCFEHQTLSDLLEAKGVTWRYYAPSPGSIWTAPDAIQHICQPETVASKATCTGPDWTNNVSIPESNILVDIPNGQLAQVSWVIPDGLESDHALTNNGEGPSWVAAILNAIGDSPYWANTAIIITWDDWGGWYDHVAPKVVNDGLSWGSGYVYGFRVPLIVAGPYAKTAYISHVNHDFGSILKFIETTYGLPSLGYADAFADDLADCFDLSSAPATFSPIPATLDRTYFVNNSRPPTAPDSDEE